MALISQSDLEARLQRNLTSEEQSSFSVMNSALQTHVERMIGSSVETASETSKYYDGGVEHLDINPCTSISAVKEVDDDFNDIQDFQSDEFIKEPYNRTVKTYLRYRGGRFPLGERNIRVDAKFSIAEETEIRDVVKDAILDALAAEISNNDNIRSETIEGYKVEYASEQTKNSLARINYLFPDIL